MQLYPDWSSRANSSRGKKRKRKQEANDGGKTDAADSGVGLDYYGVGLFFFLSLSAPSY